MWSFLAGKDAVIVGELEAAQNLASRGLRRSISTHFSADPQLEAHALHQLEAMNLIDVNRYAGQFLTRERARAMLFVPASKSGSIGLASAPGAVLRDPPPAQARPAGAADGWESARLAELLAPAKTQLTRKLANGLAVVLEQRTGLPLLTATLELPAIAHDTAEVAAAYAARMTASAERMRNGSPAAVGAFIRTSRGADDLTYSIAGSSGNTELLIALLAEHVQSVHIRKEAWASFQTYVVPELARVEQDPEAVAHRDYSAKLFEGGPFALSARSEDLTKTTRADAEAWLERTHSPAQATLVLAGDLDPDQVWKMVEDSFGVWSSKAAPQELPKPLVAPPEEPRALRLVVTPRAGTSQSELHLGCLAAPALDMQTGVRRLVAAKILEERVLARLRQEMGATYGASVTPYFYLGESSVIETGSTVETARLGLVLGALHDTIESARKTLATPDELAWAKVKTSNPAAAAQMTNEGMASAAIGWTRIGFPLSGEGRAEAIEAVTAEEARADLDACFASRTVLSIIGDETAARAAVAQTWR